MCISTSVSTCPCVSLAVLSHPSPVVRPPSPCETIAPAHNSQRPGQRRRAGRNTPRWGQRRAPSRQRVPDECHTRATPARRSAPLPFGWAGNDGAEASEGRGAPAPPDPPAQTGLLLPGKQRWSTAGRHYVHQVVPGILLGARNTTFSSSSSIFFFLSSFCSVLVSLRDGTLFPFRVFLCCLFIDIFPLLLLLLFLDYNHYPFPLSSLSSIS